MSEQSKPIIVGFVADLLFSSQIEQAASAAGFQMRWIEQAEDLDRGQPETATIVETPGENLHGRSGQLFQQITNWQPALLLFDLSNQHIPWQPWLARLKSSAATRRIPAIAFAPHTDIPLFQTAKSRGANAVYARSRFFSDLPAILQKHARQPNPTSFAGCCQQPVAERARQGILLFNQGDYYQCHDALEEAWRQEKSACRTLYQGILQYGIALYQIEKGNYRGAVKMLLRLRQWLDPLPAVCRGVDVAQLRQNIQVVSDTVQALGTDQLALFDWQLVQPIGLRE